MKPWRSAQRLHPVEHSHQSCASVCRRLRGMRSKALLLSILTGEQRLQAHLLHHLFQRFKAGEQLVQHGVVIFLQRHLLKMV